MMEGRYFSARPPVTALQGILKVFYALYQLSYPLQSKLYGAGLEPTTSAFSTHYLLKMKLL
jgi:hypothetical protein